MIYINPPPPPIISLSVIQCFPDQSLEHSQTVLMHHSWTYQDPMCGVCIQRKARYGVFLEAGNIKRSYGLYCFTTDYNFRNNVDYSVINYSCRALHSKVRSLLSPVCVVLLILTLVTLTQCSCAPSCMLTLPCLHPTPNFIN